MLVVNTDYSCRNILIYVSFWKNLKVGTLSSKANLPRSVLSLLRFNKDLEQVNTETQLKHFFANTTAKLRTKNLKYLGVQPAALSRRKCGSCRLKRKQTGRLAKRQKKMVFKWNHFSKQFISACNCIILCTSTYLLTSCISLQRNKNNKICRIVKRIRTYIGCAKRNCRPGGTVLVWRFWWNSTRGHHDRFGATGPVFSRDKEKWQTEKKSDKSCIRYPT